MPPGTTAGAGAPLTDATAPATEPASVSRRVHADAAYGAGTPSRRPSPPEKCRNVRPDPLLLLHRGHAAGDLFQAHVFLVGGEVPGVAEGILERAGPVAVELVRDRTHLGRARVQRLAELLVDVVDVEQQAHRAAPEVTGSARLHLGMLVGQHHDRVPDLDLGVPDPIVGGGNPHDL